MIWFRGWGVVEGGREGKHTRCLLSSAEGNALRRLSWYFGGVAREANVALVVRSKAVCDGKRGTKTE